MLDIYKDSWNILPNDIEVCFIDAGHSYEHCKSDIMNSLKTFKNLKFIIFDDYGVWPGVKKIVNQLIIKKILKFETFIGLNNVPGPNGLVKNVKEGIICSVNNKEYSRTMTAQNKNMVAQNKNMVTQNVSKKQININKDTLLHYLILKQKKSMNVMFDVNNKWQVRSNKFNTFNKFNN
jgi:hypothetical protein